MTLTYVLVCTLIQARASLTNQILTPPVGKCNILDEQRYLQRKKNWIEIQLFIAMTEWVAQYLIMMLLQSPSKWKKKKQAVQS